MKDVTTEMIPFASLRPCAFALNQERKDAKTRGRKERKAQFMPCARVYTGAYAFANVLLTVAGSVILLLHGTGTAFALLLVMLIAVGAWG